MVLCVRFSLLVQMFIYFFSFYIILCGKIGIYIINKDKIDDNDEDQNALALIGSRTPDGALDRSKLGNYVCPLGEIFKRELHCVINHQNSCDYVQNQVIPYLHLIVRTRVIPYLQFTQSNPYNLYIYIYV